MQNARVVFVNNKKIFTKVIDKLNHLGGAQLVQIKQYSSVSGRYYYIYNNLIIILREWGYK